MPAQTVIKIRRGSAIEWASVVLAQGEIGYDTTNNKFKVGDGTSAWTALEYISDPQEAIDAAETYTDTAIGTHNDDTTSVHGIADTSVLLTTAGGTLTGYLTLHADPAQALHAATKEYVDNLASGIIAKPAVKAATTANLSANYSNGTNGVGATLTGSSNGAFPLIDGATVTTTNGERGVLVKNQTNAAHNGRYNLTTQGDSGTPWVLTRCGLCDTNSEIPGMYVFVQDGSVNKGNGYVALVADPDTFTIGTDAINYTQFTGSGTFPVQDSTTNGEFLVSDGSAASWSNTINANAADVPAVITKGTTSQTADIQQWQNSSSSVLAAVSSIGQTFIGATNPLGSTVATSPIAIGAAVGNGTAATITPTTAAFASGIPVGAWITVAGVSPSGFNGTYQVTAKTSTTLSYANSTNATSTGAGTVGYGSASLSVASSNTHTPAIIVRGNSTQTAPLQEWQNSTGTRVATVDPSGAIFTSSTIQGGSVFSSGLSASGAGLQASSGSRFAVVGNILPTGAATSFLIRNPASGIQDPFVITNTSFAPIFQVDNAGRVYNSSPTVVPLRVIGSPSASVAIASISGTGSVVTYTVAANANPFVVGQTVTITGATTTAYNLTNAVIASVTNTTFTVNNAATGTTSTASAVSTSTQANLQEWHHSSGSAVAAIGASGSVNTRLLNLTSTGLSGTGAVRLSATLNTVNTVSGNPFMFLYDTDGTTVLFEIDERGEAIPRFTNPKPENTAKAVGFKGMPQNAPSISGNYTYTFGLMDAGEHFYATGTPTSATLTIPAATVTNFEIGTTIVIINDFGAATNLSIAINTDTLVLAGVGTTGTRTLSRFGMATLVKVTANRWIISGNGLT